MGQPLVAYQEFLIFTLMLPTGPRVPISARACTNNAQQGLGHIDQFAQSLIGLQEGCHRHLSGWVLLLVLVWQPHAEQRAEQWPLRCKRGDKSEGNTTLDIMDLTGVYIPQFPEIGRHVKPGLCHLQTPVAQVHKSITSLCRGPLLFFCSAICMYN